MPSIMHPFPDDDPWMAAQVVTYDVAELEGCALAVNASHYLQRFQQRVVCHEPLLTALGGLTGIEEHINKDLDFWKANSVTPLMIFDGQPLKGQDATMSKRAQTAVEKTNSEAWHLYFSGEAEEAVRRFGANSGAYPIQSLYPILQRILRERKLHFLVAPFNANAQIAYLDMIDSSQVGGIMGNLELLLYPVNDCIIRSIEWETRQIYAISKKNLLRSLNVSDAMFTDAFLMTGTSFLPIFPPLLDVTINPRQPYTIADAVNMLRTSEKSVASMCAGFNDILQKQDTTWLDKYQRARMAVQHFIFISEAGEVQVNDYDHLTGDNHLYLGLQLPPELLHYVNVGLISPRVLSWLTHGEVVVFPTLDGEKTEEYIKLITNQLVPLRQKTLRLVLPRLHRGLQHKNIVLKVWFDPQYSRVIYDGDGQGTACPEAASWCVKEDVMREMFPKAESGSLLFEVTALENSKFVSKTITEPKTRIKGLDSADIICSVAVWRFLHLRGYVDAKHELTTWGKALAVALKEFESTVTAYPEIPNLNEAVLMGMEMLRFGLLNARNPHSELNGLPMSGSEDDQNSLLLVSRCATLLKLRHEANGYTGPLNKNLLTYRSLSVAIREANRDLIDAIIGSMFLYSQCKRERDDYLEISQRLPFLTDPDVALAIAVKTFLDEIPANMSRNERIQRAKTYPVDFVPYAIDLLGDLRVCFKFVDVLYQGVKLVCSLESNLIPTVDAEAWEKAHKYLESRAL